jgi:hypothetical protein
MPAIPLRGDRSAWDAANYQSLHANDIDTSASAIHHTLGEGAFQAASGSHVHDLTDLSSGSATDGYVLTADGLGNAEWLPPDSWRVSLVEDTNLNDSDKLFTVPPDIEWQILWTWVEYTSTATSGSRQLELQIQDSGSVVIAQLQAGIQQDINSAYKYLFGIALPDLTAVRDGGYLTTPLPGGTFLSPGQKVRIWDNKTIDAAGDDMIVKIQYAYRSIA